MTNDIQLRDVTEDDLSIFFEHQLDPVSTQMAAFPARDRDTFLTHWAKIMADDSVTTKTILFDGHAAGYVVSFEQSDKREVGYWIGRGFWGRGVATKALGEFLGRVKTRPLYAHVAKHNLGSRRVLEKCGFMMIGEDKVVANEGGEEVEEFILKLA